MPELRSLLVLRYLLRADSVYLIGDVLNRIVRRIAKTFEEVEANEVA